MGRLPGTDPWIVRWNPVSAPRLRLLCFPYAGGGASSYRTWYQFLPRDVEVCAVQPPGREYRALEPAISRLADLLTAMEPSLEPIIDEPYATFGHSLGGLVSFELARRLRRLGQPLPQQMFISGRPAPQLHRPERAYLLPDDEFLRVIRAFNGTNQEVFDHPELVELVLPLLRADFTLNASHEYTREPPLPCPITAYFGTEDRGATAPEVAAWAEQTSAIFTLRELPGDHFFLRTAHRELLAEISHRLQAPDVGR